MLVGLVDERGADVPRLKDRLGSGGGSGGGGGGGGGGSFKLPAARQNDMVLKILPVHCHMPHPPAGPIPHPAPLYQLSTNCNARVKIAFMPAATFGSQTNACALGGCAPGGPGMVILGSFKVFFGGKPA